MGTQVEAVRYGREAADALRRAVASAKAGEPLAPVTVVVPSNHVGVAARRLLASGAVGSVTPSGRGLIACTFATVYRVAELLGAARLASSGRRPVSTPVLAAAIRSVLAEAPGLFSPVAAHPATESALVATYRELRDVSSGALDALAATGERSAEVVRVHRAVRARVAREWYDEQDLVLSAIDALEGGEGAGAGGAGGAGGATLGAVVVHLPQRLSRHGGMLLQVAARAAELHVIAGATGDARADADVRTSLGRLGAAWPVDASSDAPSLPVAVGRTSIVTTSDADDEVRAAVRAVVDAARSGTPLDRIAVLHASPEPYARLVHEHLDAAGVAVNGASVVPLTARVAGRTLLQLLATAEAGFRRQDVFAWLAAAPILVDGRPAPVPSWERLSREAAVVAGRAQWDERLAVLAEALERDAAAADGDPDVAAGEGERRRGLARSARRARAFVLELIDSVGSAAAEPRPWREHVAWAASLLHRLLGGPAGRADWPVDEQRAAERVERALDRLAALDTVEAPVGLDVFARTFELELESDLGRVGRFGEGVLVGTVGMGVGLDLDLVVVLGLAEGTFPSPARDDSLLPDDDREATGGELPLRRGQVDRQHRELLATLAGAAGQMLCVPRGDLRRSTARVPSRWALDAASQLAGRRMWSAELLSSDSPWLHHVPSYDAGLRALEVPATEQEHRLRSLMAAGVDGARALVSWPDATVAGGARLVVTRRGDGFSRYDGNLVGLDVGSPVDGTVSSTRMERWATCPFAYLLQYVLGVAVVENPEDELRITPLDKGDLVHLALERFIREVLDRPAEEQPGPDDAWTDDDRKRMLAIGEELCDEFAGRGRTGRDLFWRRDRAAILRDLLRFLEADSQHRREARTRPLAAELEFGFRRSALEAVPLELPDGRTVRFLGKADRVDVAEDGTLHVVDYKSGRSEPYGGLCEDEPDQQGRKLQLPVYGMAARLHHAAPEAPVVAEYWFVSERGRFERVGYLVSPEVLARVGRTLSTMVAGMEGGVFPARPTGLSTSPWVDCPYCDPDGLGTTELRRAWERKRHDPALVPYAQLAEPIDVDDLPVVEAEQGVLFDV